MEHALPAAAAAAHSHGGILPLPGGRWAIPLLFGRQGSRAGLIIAADPEPQSEASAGEVASILAWFFDDLCKSVKDDQTLCQFGDNLAQAYEEVNLLFRVAGLPNSAQNPDKLLETLCGELHAVLPFGWLTLKFSQQAREVSQLQGRFVVAGKPPVDVSRLERSAEALLTRCGTGESTRLLTPATSEVAAMAESDILAQPIKLDDRTIGVMLAGGLPGRDYTSGEMRFLNAMADFLSMFYQNVARFAEQRAMFLGTLKSLTASIDAKDPYTRGHSERVALLTKQLAQALGLSDRDVEMYYVAGLVHDVGKIGVPEAVLCKCGKLDEAEFAWIERHPEIGHGIIRDIPAMESVLPGVLHHHERWDGRGYPRSLVGEQIPPAARAVALADAFDAMSSNRSYRAAMQRERIVAEIRRSAGTQFDPALVEKFLGLSFSEFDRMLQGTASSAVAQAA